MLRSEAEKRIQSWFIGDKKVFKYLRPLVPVEYVVFSKLNETEIQSHPEDSTYKLPNYDIEKFMLLMINEDLVYDRDCTFSVDTKSLKTGNCKCGAWVLKDNEYLHAEGCPKRKTW